MREINEKTDKFERLSKKQQKLVGGISGGLGVFIGFLIGEYAELHLVLTVLLCGGLVAGINLLCYAILSRHSASRV